MAEPLRYDSRSLREVRKKVGLVFQNSDTQLFAPTVYQDVAFGPLNLGMTQDEIRSAVARSLAAVGLTGYEKRPPHQLSGGEKKRAAIAGTLAMEPEVLVFDEPTSSLDPAGAADLMELLDELNAQGTTIIISTHDVELAYLWADQIILMNKGTVIHAGYSRGSLYGPGTHHFLQSPDACGAGSLHGTRLAADDGKDAVAKVRPASWSARSNRVSVSHGRTGSSGPSRSAMWTQPVLMKSWRGWQTIRGQVRGNGDPGKESCRARIDITRFHVWRDRQRYPAGTRRGILRAPDTGIDGAACFPAGEMHIAGRAAIQSPFFT